MLGTLRFLLAVTIIACVAGVAAAQRPRTTAQDATDDTITVPTPAPAPASVNAKYEGGVFGYTKKMEGTLKFDDAAERLVFYNEKGKEILFVPYNALTGAYADTHKERPAAATVASHIPNLGPAGLIKTTVRYLTLQYNDPDSKVSGTASFRLENKDIIDSVLFTLAGKAGLTRRGEIFVRKASQD
jgi:hypothetical protein